MGVQLIMGFADAGSGFLSKISTGFTGANNISSPGGYSRKHPIRVSAMKYISAGFNFIVTLNEFTFGFKNVSGISVNRQTSTINEGGVNDHAIIVEDPNQSSFTLSFSRGLMIRYPQIVDATVRSAAAIVPNPIARKAALIGASSLSPQEALEKGPALGFINVYDRTNKRLLGLYSFLSLGMTEWRVSDLDAESGGLLVEDMTIIHTGITREPTVLQPFSIGSAINQESEVDKQAREAYKKIEEAKESQKEKLKDLNEKLEKLKDKRKRMIELVTQESEPTEKDLKDFDANEKSYIAKARLAKKAKDNFEQTQQNKNIEWQNEMTNEKNKNDERKAQAEANKAASKEAAEKADEAKESETERKEERIKQAEANKAASKEAAEKATEANKKQDDLNKEYAQEIIDSRKEKEDSKSDSK